jgi:UDP-glucose 4-epimerase
MKLLVTGGAGYIGSIVATQLLNAGNEVVVLDNLERGHREAVPAEARLIVADLLDRDAVNDIVAKGFDGVLHFAALALVGESAAHPERYYRTNVGGTLNLLDAMRESKTPRLVFSSTCAVYGQPDEVPIPETAPPRPTNSYGASKLAVDGMIGDFCSAHGLGAVSLRYFNVAGASGALGEDHDPETHLIPNILRAALGVNDCVHVYGTDYPTPDGTAIRDYIHIEDLAAAHILALKGVRASQHQIFNLGNGDGSPVWRSRCATRIGGQVIRRCWLRRATRFVRGSAGALRSRRCATWSATPGNSRAPTRAGTHSRSCTALSAAARTTPGAAVASIVRTRSGSSAAICVYASAIRAKN